MTLNEQIEAAFDYRGHVTLKFTDESRIVGFLFNRDFGSEQRPIQPFVEVMLEGSAEKKRFAISDLTGVELSGADEAAGKSYEDWLKKKETAGHADK